MSNAHEIIRLDASDYEDHDDCLAAAAQDYAEAHDLVGWDLLPRWDDGRSAILLTDPREITARITARGDGSTVPDNPGAVDAEIYRGDEQIGEVTLIPDAGRNGDLCTWGPSWDYWADNAMQATLREADDPDALISIIEAAVNEAAKAGA